jgi:DNA-binding NarL/FixJ family response regulator
VSALRILVGDDHEVVRKGVRALLEARPGWVVCAEVANGRDAVHQARALAPDVVILDVGMPELNGLEAAREVRSAVPRAAVLILTVHDTEEIVREVLTAGARGYVLKTDAGRDLVAAVEALACGRTFFTSTVADRVVDGYVAGGAPAPASPLTAREREIVQLLAEGLSNKEVATKLKISTKTVETHRANLMRKLRLHSLGDLVRYAIRNHLVEP